MSTIQSPVILTVTGVPVSNRVSRSNRLTSKFKRGYIEDAANEALTCDLRYQGQIEDRESGLYYNLNRYYDADSGQYLSPDPIGMAGEIRPQGYVDNRVECVDPLGLVGCCKNEIKKELPGPTLPQDIADTFEDSVYTNRKLTKNTTVLIIVQEEKFLGCQIKNIHLRQTYELN